MKIFYSVESEIDGVEIEIVSGKVYLSVEYGTYGFTVDDLRRLADAAEAMANEHEQPTAEQCKQIYKYFPRV